MIQSHIDATLYILTTLIKNGGIYNFILLDGRKFRNETERFAIRDILIENGSIVKVQGAIGQTYRLTELGNQNFYNLCYRRVLQYLSENPQFIKVSNILQTLSIPDDAETLSNDIESQLNRDKLVFGTENDGVMINDDGKLFLRSNDATPLPTPHIVTKHYYQDNSITTHGNVLGNLVAGSNNSIENTSVKHGESSIEKIGIIDLLKKYWWGIAIPLILGLALLMIEYKWFSTS